MFSDVGLQILKYSHCFLRLIPKGIIRTSSTKLKLVKALMAMRVLRK